MASIKTVRRRLAIWSARTVSLAAMAATAAAAAQTAATQPGSTQPSATAPAAADPAAAAAAVVGRVDELVAKLSDPTYLVRKRATDALERLGEPAEPVLRERIARPDLPPDARTAIEVLLKQAGERRRIGASLVTVDLKQAEPLEAVGAVLKQAGLGMAAETEKLLRAKAGQKVDVRLDREPFWAALRKVAADAGVAFAGLELAEFRVSLVAAGGAGGDGAGGGGGANSLAPPAASDGPFLLTVGRVEVTVRKVVDFAARRHPNNAILNAAAAASPPVRVSVSAWAEPRVKPAAWVVEGVTECKTDTGKTLTASTYYYSRNNKVNDASTTFLSIAGDTAGAKALAKLTVRGKFVLQYKSEPLVVDDVQNGVKELGRTVAGHRVIVRSVAKQSEDTWSYEVSIFRDGRSPQEWLVLQQVLDRDACRLEDAAGKPLQPRGGGSSLGADEIKVSGTVSRAGGAGEPRRLRWELPGKLETLPATFEFTDVPLPQ